ncbi:hypothetical protein M079_4377 [Bacteroides fragilis str. 3996 N(B) 6]|uniref:Uncharacterized protein n=1 Tax=Bacteroides fragilis str. 3998T(B)3 TaxID=1339316 RepID=A0A015VRL4_BACFG|nr:hypothetical protein M079_4377 [Bacteroides fragilis str. 3996 N(B) 6]EXY88523.1 hypothetical protein M125_4853 [Bacteroides fragilis str. 3998T(B)3]EXY93584.1 hypothetical protein M081_4340 [Bacteroides fragilis str. 3998 T(B) 4]EXZ76564.1 hypothetical protein M144_4159 [Bacteroides fragilis str. 3-F-2 \
MIFYTPEDIPVSLETEQRYEPSPNGALPIYMTYFGKTPPL